MNQRHLLLISGPSGGGKSTFIRQLAANSLAPDILSLLPDACGSWPVIEANNVLKGNLSPETLRNNLQQADAWLVHYDIVFIHCHGLALYQDDPAMTLLTNADSLTVVFIRPDCEVLRQQFLDRQIRHQQTKSTASLWWGRWVRRPLRRALAPLTGKPILTSAELYADNKWLAACYLQWETFCQHLMESHPQTRLLTVEPASGPSEHFRLLAHPGQTPANNLSDNA
jgi:hypothetical protein